MTELIKLTDWPGSIVADSREGYKERAKKLVEAARRRKANKSDVSKAGLECLIGAGARIYSLNNIQCGNDNTYLSQVIYEEIQFILISEGMFSPVIENCYRHE